MPDCAKSDEMRLREQISALKAAWAVAQRAMVEVEEVNGEEEEVEGQGRGRGQGHPRQDQARLEEAVLVQELMAAKEEKADLKAQVRNLRHVVLHVLH